MDFKDVLKRESKKFFKEGGVERYVIEVEGDCNSMEVLRYRINAVDDLRRQTSLGTVDDCMSIRLCAKEWNVEDTNESMKGQYFNSKFKVRKKVFDGVD